MSKSTWTQAELLRMLDFMADKLTVAGMALAALDDLVDPLDREHMSDHWAMAHILTQAQRELFDPLPSPFPVKTDVEAWIHKARRNQWPDPRELDAFEVVKAELRKTMAAQFRKVREAA